jgi:hypothetical protein
VSRTLDRHIAGRDVQHAVLFSRIAILNAHRGLSARQVFDVLQGDRSIMRKSGSETA